MLANILYTRPTIEQALSALDKSRLKLPVLNPRALFDDFESQPVTLVELSQGPWSSPVADTVMLAKFAMCAKPKRVLEVGSYRGFTTKMLARHTAEDARIVAFDRDPRHGEAYRGTAWEAKIERRVGDMCEEAFVQDMPGSYDLIFLDADHSYDAVKRDTEILLPLIAKDGLFIWHDYANWGRFSRKNGVPEYLHECSRNIPIANVNGSWLAVYSPAWASTDGIELFNRACNSDADKAGTDPWTIEVVRG
ncbi:class I SAM-dependent methyltransferase [Phenylobacterium sp.]|uniref:class I SAM-dependent methyltransferase n=1 Tax=Phenylobacterium sp. TaxID=1871053 RepID=UPI00272B735B|nr:class I SAM-dependent methyltransferase [Phenylobacterium sp.]